MFFGASSAVAGAVSMRSAVRFFLVVVAIAGGCGFLGVLYAVLAKNSIASADQSVHYFFQSLRTPWADQVFVVLTELGDSFVNFCLFGAILIVLLAKRCFFAAGIWTVAVPGGSAGIQLLKEIIHLPRPMSLYHGASSYGFPSAHTAMSIILYGFLTIMLVRRPSGAWRWGIVGGALLICFGIGMSRLYLGAHWLSDVLGGFFIGASWVALLGIVLLKRPDEGVPGRILGVATILVVLVAGGWHVVHRYEKDLIMYAPRKKVLSMGHATQRVTGAARQIDTADDSDYRNTIRIAHQGYVHRRHCHRLVAMPAGCAFGGVGRLPRQPARLWDCPPESPCVGPGSGPCRAGCVGA